MDKNYLYNNIELDTALLTSFLAVYELQNFTYAAERLGRTQAAISLQIKKLEEILGKTLFNRSRNNIILTSEGEILITYAKKILNLKQDLINHFKQPAAQGEVHFGSPEDFATIYLSNVLANFAENYPKVTMNVYCDLTLNLLENFKKGIYDIIVIKQDKIDHSLNGELIREDSLVWVGNNRHNITKLNEYEDKIIPLVLSPSPCVYRQRALDALNKKGSKWRITYTSPSLAGTIAAVKAGLGYTVLPKDMVNHGLKMVNNSYLPQLQDIQIVMLKKTGASEAVNEFANYILNHINI